MRTLLPLGLLGALALLPACKDPAAPANAAAGVHPQMQAAIDAATSPLRQRLRMPGDLRQRGVQVFAQALPGTYAVCGRVNASGTAGDAFIPYVALVAFEGPTPQVANLVVGLTGNEASRTYVEMTERCYEGGGPPSTRVAARGLPPLPEPPAPPAVTLAAAAAAEPVRAAIGRVTTSATTGANVRATPRGGEVLRTAPRNTTLEVFGEAPGGWLQVGLDGAPWGWVHASVLASSGR